MPILDVLQSVPILSFLPVVLLVLTTIFPSRFGVEVTAVVLIFTSQAWNIAYSFHQSLRTAPTDLQEASQNFRFNWWYRLRYLELPFGMRGLLWNSVVSSLLSGVTAVTYEGSPSYPTVDRLWESG